MPSVRLETISLSGLVIRSSVNTVAYFDTINPNAAGASMASNNLGSYVDIGTIPYSVMTVVAPTTLLISAGVTWTNAVVDCVRSIYIEYKQQGTSTWVTIAGNTTRSGPAELNTAWRTGNVSLAYNMNVDDQFRVVYFTSSGVTLAYVNALTTGRVRPYLAIAAV